MAEPIAARRPRAPAGPKPFAGPFAGPSCAPSAVTVETTARLHVGFMDLNFSLGRRFGSVGFAIDAPVTRLTARRAPATPPHARIDADSREAGSGEADLDRRSGPDAARAERYARATVRALGLPEDAVQVQVERAIPPHAGLGSGTQMALAAGRAVAALAGLAPQDLPARDIARLLGRGGRSGVGIATFETGGIVLDAGKDRDTHEPPPVVWRHALPAAWRFVLVFDDTQTGVHGSGETAAFAQAPAMAEDTCGEICRMTLMQLVPAVIEGDVRGFGAAVTAIQARTGDHFAPFQGGRRFASPAVAGALDWMARNGAAGIGQSSWGPTGYGVAADPAAAARLADGLAARRLAGLSILTVAALDRGARVTCHPPA